MSKLLTCDAFKAALQISGSRDRLLLKKLHRFYGQACVQMLQRHGLLRLDHHSIQHVYFDNERWAYLVAIALGVTPSAALKPMIPQRLWAMGDLAILGIRMPWLLGNYLTVSELGDALSTCHYSTRPLVLTSFPLPQSHYTVLPHNPYQMACSELLISSDGRWQLDRHPLEQLIQPTVTESSHISPVRIERHGKRLYIYDRLYRFNSERKAFIIRSLVEAWQSGHPKRNTEQLLTAAGYDNPVLSLVFSGSTQWREFIGQDDGQCWLIVSKNVT